MKWVILVLALSGCASNSDGWNVWTGYGQQHAEASPTDRFANECSRLGYTPNTDPWRDCILKTRSFELDRRRAILEQYQRERPTSCYRDALGTTCY